MKELEDVVVDVDDTGTVLLDHSMLHLDCQFIPQEAELLGRFGPIYPPIHLDMPITHQKSPEVKLTGCPKLRRPWQNNTLGNSSGYLLN